MSFFSPREAVGLTWNSAGQCHGLRLRQSGDQWQITALWEAQAETSELLAGTLAAGWQHLAADQEALLALGGTAPEAFSAVLPLPPLPPDAARQAARLALPRLLLLPAEEMEWALLRPAQNGQAHQILAMRQQNWQQWLNAAQLLHPDLLVPVMLAIPPDARLALEDFNVRLAADGSFASDFDESPGGELIAQIPGLRLGPLKPEQVKAYEPALALARLALNPLHRARILGFEVPRSLRPPRLRRRKLLLGLAVAALGLLGSLWGARVFLARHQQDRAWDARRVEFEALQRQASIPLAELQGRQELLAACRLLGPRHFAGPALLALSQTLPRSCRCTSLNFASGQLTVTASTPPEMSSETLYQALRSSPYFDRDVILSPGTSKGQWTFSLKPAQGEP